MEDVFDEQTRLYKDGDNWIFESDFNTDEITGDAEGAPEAMFDALFGDASFQITVDLPGRAIPGENNATTVGDDGVFTWDIDILNPPAQLIAKTEPGSGGGTGGGSGGGGLLRILAIVAALAVLGAGAWWFLTQRKPAGTGGGEIASPDADAGMPAGQMPLMDGPPVAAQAQSVVPTADATKETVMLSAQDVPGAAAAAATTAAAATPAALEPIFDEALGAWVVDDPTRGRLRHDPQTDTWNPI